MRLRLLVLLLASVGLPACGSHAPPRMGPDPAEYEIRDTARYENTLAEGEYGLLVRDGVVVDSVDLAFGVHRLNNGAVVILPVEASPSEEFPQGMDIGEHVMFSGRRRVPLNSFLPHFSDYFSSPAVLDGVLYYWGLEHLGDGEYRVHAQRYDPRARRVTSRFLLQTEVATDFRGHFPPPMLENGRVVYYAPEQTFILDPQLQQVEVRQ